MCDLCPYCFNVDCDKNGMYCMIVDPVPTCTKDFCNYFIPEITLEASFLGGPKK